MNSFPATPLPERLATGLAKLGLALKSKSWREGLPRGLTPTQGQMLAALLAAGRRGKALGELARTLGVTPPTATDAAAALERKGFVRRLADASDRRVRRLALTRKGAAAARSASGWPDFLAEAAGRLEESEQAALLGVLIKMIRHLQERGEIPVARMCAECLYFRPGVHRDPRRPHHCDFVDAPFGDRDLRLDCEDFEPALISITQRR